MQSTREYQVNESIAPMTARGFMCDLLHAPTLWTQWQVTALSIVLETETFTWNDYRSRALTYGRGNHHGETIHPMALVRRHKELHHNHSKTTYCLIDKIHYHSLTSPLKLRDGWERQASQEDW